MTPDDPRHGRRAGYIAGCRADCCRNPHLRYQKFSTLRLHREGSQYVPTGPTLDRVAWWRERGVTPNAIAAAAGIAPDALIRPRPRVRKSTEAKVLAVSWESLPDTALVNADLTRARIYSLMASGHTLAWIGERVTRLTAGGKWRVQERVTLGFAREVMALCESAPEFGPSRIALAKARNRGHVHPIGWDDPGTPAEPHGWRPEIDRADQHSRPSDVDHAVVERMIAGDRMEHTARERREVVAYFWRLGLGAESIAKKCGLEKHNVDQDIRRLGFKRGAA